jgi:uncharacterized protein (TIGR02611 family)
MAGQSPQRSGEAAGQRREPPKLVRRLKERQHTHKEHGRIYRTVWVVAGFTVVAAGGALLVLPGPALLIIPIGLAMLSLEFAWAERLLDTTLERGLAITDVARRASRRQQVLGGLALVFAIAAVAAAAYLFVL